MSYFEREEGADQRRRTILIYDPGEGDNVDIDLCSAEEQLR